jgi:plasmid stabilization system protein ParE
LPEAEAEFTEAVDYYRARSIEAAADLADAVEEALEWIAGHPRSCPRVDTPRIRGEHRYKMLRRFPYRVVFEVRDDEVVVKAIAHYSRRPGYWARRRG